MNFIHLMGNVCVLNKKKVWAKEWHRERDGTLIRMAIVCWIQYDVKKN